VLWTGCHALVRAAVGDVGGVADPAERLWAAAGRDPRAVVRDRCCGAPLRAAGDLDTFAAAARASAAALAASGATRVVAACPVCAQTMRDDWPRAGAKLDLDIVDLAAWARDALGPVRSATPLALVEPPPDEPADRAAIADLFAECAPARLPWPAEVSDPTTPGARVRAAIETLSADAARQGAHAIVVPSAHHATRWRLVAAAGAWRTGAVLPVLDTAEALVVYGR
jgi:hypothetical protein